MADAITHVRLIFEEGRASQGQFWRMMALVWGAGLIHYLFGYILEPGLWVLFGGLWFVVALLLCVDIGMRRLNDCDIPAWAIVVLFIPYVGLVLLIVLGFVPGTPGPNRFGPDPLGRSPEVQASEEIAALRQGTDPHLAHHTQTSPLHTPRDLVGEIERLAQLKAAGTLSETEFEVLKAQALRQGP